MHLPIHPDVCFAYVRALRECGYRWLMVQEHTIESSDGTALRQPHLPHLLVARNSEGETASIPVLIKTQGSDTKLVGQMQPFGEAKSLDRQPFAGAAVPPYSLQIGDGENGGVMMNEFPSAYERGFDELGGGGGGVVAMNGTEYLEALAAMGVDERAFPTVQPVSQHRIWEQMTGSGPGATDRAIARVRERDPSFNLDRASWTSDRSWVAGYGDVMDPDPAPQRRVSRTVGSDRSAASTPSRPTRPTALPCCTCCSPRPAAFATGATASGQTLRRRSVAAVSSP